MSGQKLSVTIEDDDREGLIYWLERLTEKLKENPRAVSGRSSGGGYLDWVIVEARP